MSIQLSSFVLPICVLADVDFLYFLVAVNILMNIHNWVICGTQLLGAFFVVVIPYSELFHGANFGGYSTIHIV